MSVPVHLNLQRRLFVIEPSVGILTRSVYAQSELPIEVRARIHQEQTPVTTAQDKETDDD